MPSYIIYARKSSESEDRQVLSIDSQIHELREHAQSNGLHVSEVLSESRSAKSPGRPVFSWLLKQISAGHLDGIICWKLDRLARNPVDGGALIWAFDEGKLREISTPQRTFVNNGNDKFWMQLEFGMAKKYVDDLSENVKRGNRAKLEQGWLPGVPPVGYMNDLATKTIIPDSDRFDIVRKMWDMLFAGVPVSTIRDTANDSWGFRTRRFKRMGGNRLAENSLYKLFSNPFYYGLIVRNGKTYPGSHRPMVTSAEFDEAQRILGRPNRPSRNRHAFAYTGLIRCGECGCAITAEDRVNRYGSRYVYYHCSKRHPGTRCSQRSIRLENIEAQIKTLLTRIHVDNDFHQLAVQYARARHAQDLKTGAMTKQSLDRCLRECQMKLDRLTDLRINGLLSDPEFAAKRNKLVSERLRLDAQRRSGDTHASRCLEFTENTFTFANQAIERFKKAALDEKREIVLTLGSNFTLTDKTLHIQLQKPLELIQEGLRSASGVTAQNSSFEPSKNAPAENKNNGFPAVISAWQATVEQVRTFFSGHSYPGQWLALLSADGKKTIDRGAVPADPSALVPGRETPPAYRASPSGTGA